MVRAILSAMCAIVFAGCGHAKLETIPSGKSPEATAEPREELPSQSLTLNRRPSKGTPQLIDESNTKSLSQRLPLNGQTPTNARQLAQRALALFLEQNHHEPYGGTFFIVGGCAFEILGTPSAAHAELIDKSYSSTDSGIAAQFTYVPAAVKVRGKVMYEFVHREEHYDAEGFPFLFPWSPPLSYAQVFPPCVITYYKNSEIGPSVSGFFQGASALTPEDVCRLLGEDQNVHLSDSGRVVHSSFSDFLPKCFHWKGKSLFVTTASELVEAATANYAQNADRALEWDSIYEQNTELTIQEVHGKHQVWIDEARLSQTDQINGIIGNGTATFAYRGFSRSATVSAHTRYLQRKDVWLSPGNSWGKWSAPQLHKLEWKYELRADGTVRWTRERTDNELALGFMVENVRGGNQSGGPVAVYGTSRQTFERVMREHDYKSPTLPEEDTNHLIDVICKRPR